MKVNFLLFRFLFVFGIYPALSLISVFFSSDENGFFDALHGALYEKLKDSIEIKITKIRILLQKDFYDFF